MFAANQGLNQVTQPSWSMTTTEQLAAMQTWQSTGAVTQTAVNTLSPSTSGSGPAYRSFVYHPDGNFYSAPYWATGNIMVVNTATNAVSYPGFGVSGLSGSAYKYQAGCFAPTNGKIYYPPVGTNNVLIIDPATQTSQTQTWGLTFSGTDQYWTATLGTNNKIYCIGNATGNVLVIDPVANTASTTTFGGVWTASALRTLGAVRSIKNGKIYASPYNGGTFFVIDTSTANATGNTTSFGSAIAAGAYQGISQDTQTGNLVCIATNITTSLVIDPVANTRTSISTGITKTIGPSVAADGRVYGAPFTGSSWFVYNPLTGNIANSITANTFGNATSVSYSTAVAAGNKVFAFAEQAAANAYMRVLTVSGTGNLNPPLLNTVLSSPGINGTGP